MAVALAASPGQAVPAMPAGGFGVPTPVSPVNAVSPRFTDTPAWHVTETGEQHLKRMAEVIALAKPVVFLASDDRSYVAGTELFVDGGFAQV
jgi:hypothetical protein